MEEEYLPNTITNQKKRKTKKKDRHRHQPYLSRITLSMLRGGKQLKKEKKLCHI